MLALVPLVLAWGATYEPTPTELGSGVNGSAIGDQFGFVVAATPSLLAVSAPGSQEAAGTVSMYAWNGSDWIQRGADIVGGPGYYAGTALAVSGDVVVVGASTAGIVLVYAWDGTQWAQRGPALNGTDNFGFSVSASGDAIAIGTPSARMVQVYDWTGTAWTQRGLNLTSPNTDGLLFGYSVSLSGNTLAVGEQFAGEVRVYDWNGTLWAQRGAVLSDGTENVQAHSSVSLSGRDTLAVGAASGGLSEAGVVRVYAWNGTQWSQQGETITGAEPGSNLGYSVSLSGSVLAAGAPAASGATIAGHVLVYDLVAGHWRQRGPTLNGTAAGTHFGFSVALAAGRLAVGAPLHSEDTGQVRVYNYAAVDGSSSGLRRDAIVGIAIGGAAVAVAGVGLAVHWGC
jgi:hypothetical protein